MIKISVLRDIKKIDQNHPHQKSQENLFFTILQIYFDMKSYSQICKQYNG